MKKLRKCPNCGIDIEYTTKGNLDRAIKKNSMCKGCSIVNNWKNQETRKKASESRKLYLSNLSDFDKIKINLKVSEKNKETYNNRSDEWKEKWRSICSETSSARWDDPEYKRRVSESMSRNNWSMREDSQEIKKKQVESRISNNGGFYSRGPGRCKEFTVAGIKCYGTFEKKYIEILVSSNMDLPKNVDESILTDYGSYTPDFEFPDFYVEVKSRFTYDVLIGKKSYSKNRKSSPDQLNKISWVSNNLKKIRIAIIDNGTIEYIDL